MQYIDNDFYLVEGFTYKQSGKYKGYGYYDFEKHSWTPEDEDTGLDDTTKTIPIAKKPLKKLSDFTIGEYSFEDY